MEASRGQPRTGEDGRGWRKKVGYSGGWSETADEARVIPHDVKLIRSEMMNDFKFGLVPEVRAVNTTVPYSIHLPGRSTS